MPKRWPLIVLLALGLLLLLLTPTRAQSPNPLAKAFQTSSTTSAITSPNTFSLAEAEAADEVDLSQPRLDLVLPVLSPDGQSITPYQGRVFVDLKTLSTPLNDPNDEFVMRLHLEGPDAHQASSLLSYATVEVVDVLKRSYFHTQQKNLTVTGEPAGTAFEFDFPQTKFVYDPTNHPVVRLNFDLFFDPLKIPKTATKYDCKVYLGIIPASLPAAALADINWFGFGDLSIVRSEHADCTSDPNLCAGRLFTQPSKAMADMNSLISSVSRFYPTPSGSEVRTDAAYSPWSFQFKYRRGMLQTDGLNLQLSGNSWWVPKYGAYGTYLCKFNDVALATAVIAVNSTSSLIIELDSGVAGVLELINAPVIVVRCSDLLIYTAPSRSYSSELQDYMNARFLVRDPENPSRLLPSDGFGTFSALIPSPPMSQEQWARPNTPIVQSEASITWVGPKRIKGSCQASVYFDQLNDYTDYYNSIRVALPFVSSPSSFHSTPNLVSSIMHLAEGNNPKGHISAAAGPLHGFKSDPQWGVRSDKMTIALLDLGSLDPDSRAVIIQFQVFFEAAVADSFFHHLAPNADATGALPTVSNGFRLPYQLLPL